MESKYGVSFVLSVCPPAGYEPFVFGNTPELGSGNIWNGKKLTKIENTDNYKVFTTFDQNPEGRWYKYCLINSESHLHYERIPDRLIPEFPDSSYRISLLDTFDQFPEDQEADESQNPVHQKFVSDVTVKIRVAYHTHFGENLYMAGDAEEIGNWDIKKPHPLQYLDEQHWFTQLHFPCSKEERIVHYKYFVVNDQTGYVRWEPCEDHSFTIPASEEPIVLDIVDPFRFEDDKLENISKKPFTDVFLHRNERNSFSPDDVKLPSNEVENDILVKFTTRCTLRREGQTMKVTGSIPELGEWDPTFAIQMSDANYPEWSLIKKIPKDHFPFEYKCIITDHNQQVIWESRSNRMMVPIYNKDDPNYPLSLQCNDWLPTIQVSENRGLCVKFDLSKTWGTKSCGKCATFYDITELVSFCNQVKAAMLQVSNVFDEHSAFALNAAFIDLLQVQELLNHPSSQTLQNTINNNVNSSMNLTDLKTFKLSILKEVFQNVQNNLVNNADYQQFKQNNDELWLNNWANYSSLNEDEIKSLILPPTPTTQIKIRGSDDDCEFYKWVQYLCHQQLSKISEYAKEHRIALRCEIPFMLEIDSCDYLYHRDAFTGLETIIDNRRLHYATYAWTKNTKSWWSQRIQRISQYFQSIRVLSTEDLVLTSEVSPTMLASSQHKTSDFFYTKEQLEDLGLWDFDRYTKPYIRTRTLREVFGNDANYVMSKYFLSKGPNNSQNKFHFFKYNTLDLVEERFQAQIADLLSDVLLIDANEKYYIPNRELGRSWRSLPEPQKTAFYKLYNDEEEKRQRILEVSKQILEDTARPKVRMITQNGTNTEIIADDSFYVMEVTKEIEQTKTRDGHFQDTRYLPYNSVSTFNTELSINQWWVANHRDAFKYWREELWRDSLLPDMLSGESIECIIRMHMWNNSKWVVLRIEDIDALLDTHYSQNNVAGSKYPFSLEDLLANTKVISKMAQITTDSKRIIE